MSISGFTCLTDIAKYFQQRGYELIILRSSCTDEDIHARGKYSSKYCKPRFDDICSALGDVYSDFERNKERQDLQLAVLIQVYQRPKIKGHISNERRVNPSKQDWLIEEEMQNGAPNRSTGFSVGNDDGELELSLVTSLNYPTVVTNLKKFAAYFSRLPDRYHIEWVWDGLNLWMVQIDHEAKETNTGTRPGSQWKTNRELIAGTVVEDLAGIRNGCYSYPPMAKD